MGKIVTHMLGGEAAPALIQAIAELTEGNPFFTQEIARALLKFDQIEARGPVAAAPEREFAPARRSARLDPRTSGAAGRRRSSRCCAPPP